MIAVECFIDTLSNYEMQRYLEIMDVGTFSQALEDALGFEALLTNYL